MLYYFRVRWKRGRVNSVELIGEIDPPIGKRGLILGMGVVVIARDELDAFALATKWKADNQ